MAGSCWSRSRASLLPRSRRQSPAPGTGERVFRDATDRAGDRHASPLEHIGRHVGEIVGVRRMQSEAGFGYDTADDGTW